MNSKPCPEQTCKYSRAALPDGSIMSHCYQHLPETDRECYRTAMDMNRKCVSRVIGPLGDFTQKRRWAITVRITEKCVHLQDYGILDPNRPRPVVEVLYPVREIEKMLQGIAENPATKMDAEAIGSAIRELLAGVDAR